MTKICIDCKHYFENPDGRWIQQKHMCMKFSETFPASQCFITGQWSQKYTRYFSCLDARLNEDFCGKEGNCWELKE